MSLERWGSVALCDAHQGAGMLSFDEIVRRGAKMKKNPNLPVPLPLEQSTLFIEHKVDGEVIPQRPRDGYINATLLCQRAGKKFNNYHRNEQTTAFLEALSTETRIRVSDLIQIVKGGNDKLSQGTWVHPKVAINLAQWLSPRFAVQVSDWVFDWLSGNVKGYMPVHVQRYIKNRSKIPFDHFSMLNEIYLNFLAPLEDFGIIPPDKVMPDISTGMMFSDFLRKKGINPKEFKTYEHEFVDDTRPTVEARLYPIKYLEDFRRYFNNVWLPRQAPKYLEKRFPKALPYLNQIAALPAP